MTTIARANIVTCGLIPRDFHTEPVIVNERASSYVQDFQSLLDQTARRAKGAVYLLRADLITRQARRALMAAASVVLEAGRGGICAQLDPMARPACPAPAPWINGIAARMARFVPLSDPVKAKRLTLHNT